jgi:hypothetical protein
VSNLYLKAESESAMLAALDKAGLVIDGVVQVCGKADVYVIGAMYSGDENLVPLPGYHANVRTDNAEVIAKLEPLTCVVVSPAFVFA